MKLSTLFRCGTTPLKRMSVPRYLSEYSKKDFRVHQHLLIIAVKELEKETYRGLIDRLEDSKVVDDFLNLKRIPHYTTPEKILKRVPRAGMHILLKRTTSWHQITIMLWMRHAIL
ncbi:MAG: hypothetical protein ACE5KV_09530 [Thermoplasmata archaeon]